MRAFLFAENSTLSIADYCTVLIADNMFSVLAAKGNANTENESNYILEDLKSVLNHIEQSTMGTESEEDFNALFEDLDLNSTKIGRTVGARNEIIAKILSYLDKIDFKLEEIESDVLGDAYEYLIGKFAAGGGKSAGEFYTPQQVSKILAKIVTTGKSKIKSVYDPTCGSGSLLLRVAKEAEVSEFFGQELNRTAYNLARMNMILHDVHYRNFRFEQEDTLENRGLFTLSHNIRFSLHQRCEMVTNDSEEDSISPRSFGVKSRPSDERAM